MTIQSSTLRADYDGNGVTTSFPVSFYFLDSADLEVQDTNNTVSPAVVTTLVLGLNYTVTGARNPSGGVVTISPPPATGHSISIVRNVPLTQLVHYVDGDPLPAASLEQTFDKLTMIAQQQQEQINLSHTLAGLGGQPLLGYTPLNATAQAVDSARLGGQLPSFYQTALGYTPLDATAQAADSAKLGGQLPSYYQTPFGASGPSHAKGLVPDPGATAGTTKFLREDGTWVALTGGGTVTSVGATAPVVSSGGAAPVISMPAATASVDGYLKASDFAKFNASPAFNRINNGRFYLQLSPWVATSGLAGFSSTVSQSTGTGSAVLTATGNTSGASSRSDNVVQAFNCPPSTATLTLYWSCAVTGGNLAGDGGSAAINLYLFNHATGTETLLDSWSQTVTSQITTPTWSNRSVNVTSYLSGGGEFTIRAAMSASANGTTVGTNTVGCYLDSAFCTI